MKDRTFKVKLFQSAGALTLNAFFTETFLTKG